MKKLIINSENSHLNDDNTVDVPPKESQTNTAPVVYMLGGVFVLVYPLTI